MGRLNVRKFSHSLDVRYVTEADFRDIAALCAGNPLYYKYYGSPAPAAEDIRADLEALPPGKSKRDKYYLSAYGPDGRLTAVLDLVVGYPDAETAWIGFFMLDAGLQGRGLGSRIISELLEALTGYGFRRAALGVVSGNPQAEAFWLKNGFSFYGAPRVDRSPVIRTMERVLNLPDKVYTHHFDIGGSHMNEYLDIKPEVREALEAGAPVVALESTILSHGMPWPENLDFAAKVEEVVRAEGAVPATMAIMGGKLKVGLSEADLEVMCRAEGVGKVSRRDVPVYIASGRNGATTVATTMLIANMAGVRVFATGGIGGVHRHGEDTMDISADLQELAHTSVAVVCAGAKQILDIGRTLEYLETMGVPVIGVGTDEFPAFYCRRSGHKLDYAAKDEAEIAAILKAKWALGMDGGVLIANPIAEADGLDFDYMEGIINVALEAADAAGVHGKDITPFLLAKVKELTGGESFKSNVALALNNARVAAKIAVEYAKK